MKRKKLKGRCPICGKRYELEGQHKKEIHHLFFPKRNYTDNVELSMCHECHSGLHNIQDVPTAKQCLVKLGVFCKYRGKNVYEIYPILIGVVP